MPVVLEGGLHSRDPIASVKIPLRDGRVERVLNLLVRFTIRESGWSRRRHLELRTLSGSPAPRRVFEVDGRPMQPRRESAQFFVDWSSAERMAKLDALTEITTTQKEELLQPGCAEAEVFGRGKLAATVVLPRPPLKKRR